MDYNRPYFPSSLKVPIKKHKIDTDRQVPCHLGGYLNPHSYFVS